MNTGTVSLEGTLIEEILKTDPKAFKPINQKGRSAPKKADILGTLNDFERACMVLRIQKIDKHIVHHEQEGDDLKTGEHIQIHTEIELLEKLVHCSVGRRIPYNEKHAGFRIYDDKIVAIYTRPPQEARLPFPFPAGFILMVPDEE